MKSSCVSSMSAAGLLLIALIGQVGSFKLAKYPAAVSTSNDVGSPSLSVQQQEEAIRREQLLRQRQIDFLQQQERQTEFQIQQQQLEAQHLMGRPLHQPSQEFATKGSGPAPSAPAQQFSDYSNDRQQYGPPRSTIAYLLVRPPYQMPLPYDEPVFQRTYQPMIRPYNFPGEYARPSGPEIPLAATKGARQEDYPQPPPPPPQPSQPQPPPALVVPVHGDKHGKLRAMLDKLMSKLSISSYEVSGEEYVYPTPCTNCKAPSKQQEPPIVQQPITQQQVIEQIRDEEVSPSVEQQPIQQQSVEQQQQPQLPQQQQQQTFIEQDKDQSFGESTKSAPSPQRPLDTIKQEQTKLEEYPQQQQQVQLPAQEQEPLDLGRAPQSSIKGAAPQQPIRQPESIQQQQQRVEEPASSKGPTKRYQQQQYFTQQQSEPIRQEQSGGF